MDSWRGEIFDGLEKLVDHAVTAGARQEEVFAEITKIVGKLKIANEHDPDPADATSETVIDEPANNWPGAER
jgi:hypothetical protein